MNNTKKYIWSFYVLIWVYILFFDSSYQQGDHIVTYLFFGWIPFVIFGYIWTDNKISNISRENTSFEEQYKDLFKIVEKEKILNLAKVGKDSKILLEDSSKELDSFYQRVGVNKKDLENNNSEVYFSLKIEDMKSFETIKNNILQFGILTNFVDAYMNTLDNINAKLAHGLSINTAKTMYESSLKTLNEEKNKATVNMVSSRVIGEELIKMIESVKKKNPNATAEEINKVKISGDKLKKRIAEELKKEFKLEG